MNQRRLVGVRGRSANKGTAVGAVVGAMVAAAVTLAGPGVAPAQSATDSSCPPPYPVAKVAVDQRVHGLTVTKGTTPEGFTGTVLGVMTDGIAPGIDMIMVRLSSSELDRVGGIWEGMSGSPVYATDGRLIGAVAYGLSTGPSEVAGVTPAADMEALLSTPPASTGAATAHKSVAISPPVARRIVASGSATQGEVSQGMSQLRLPFGISGVSARHFKKLQKLFTAKDMQRMQSGGASTSAPSAPIVPGGNLAASVSYGDVTAAGVGTATAVCGDEVLAFGHPMNFSGPATLTMHGADALYIQEDPTVAGFKVANITDPVGTVTDDRTAGLRGLLGPAPTTADITSLVQMGSRSRTGTTHISVPDAVPDLATSHLLADEDRVFDGFGKGSATVAWTIRGQREDGTAFRLVRTNRYADPSDLTFATALDFNDTLYALAYNGFEDVTLGSITTTSTLSRDYLFYTLGSVKVRAAGKWRSVSPTRPLNLARGTTRRFRVTLTSRALPTKTIVLKVPIPTTVAGRDGYLDVFGGNTGSEGDGPEANTPTSFPAVLSKLRRAPHHDDVVASLSFFSNDGGTITRTTMVSAGHVVNGALTIAVHGTR